MGLNPSAVTLKGSRCYFFSSICFVLEEIKLSAVRQLRGVRPCTAQHLPTQRPSCRRTSGLESTCRASATTGGAINSAELEETLLLLSRSTGSSVLQIISIKSQIAPGFKDAEFVVTWCFKATCSICTHDTFFHPPAAAPAPLSSFTTQRSEKAALFRLVW